MEEPIPATCLNDFIFCPASIYYHRFYDSMETMAFQQPSQINGTDAHKTVDNSSYSTARDVLTSLDAYSEKLGLTCKIDIYYSGKKLLVERKKKIREVYDGYVFQLYAQYYCMKELGYNVEKLQLYSMDDNKKYNVRLPDNDIEMKSKFLKVIDDIVNFDIRLFEQTNVQKCKYCIYEPACAYSLLGSEDFDD